MTDQKYLFSLFLTLSLALHVVFFFLTTRIHIQAGMEIEKEIKKVFRMRDITFQREVRVDKKQFNVRKIQFPNLKQEILQEAQKLIFDNKPYERELVEGASDVLRDPAMKKSMNFYESVTDPPEVLYAVDSQAKEEILIAEKLSFIPLRKNGSVSSEEALLDLDTRMEKKMQSEDQRIHSQSTQISYDELGESEPIETVFMSGDQMLESMVDVSFEESNLLVSEVEGVDIISKLDNMDNLIELKVDHSFLEGEMFGYFRMKLNLKDAYTGLKPFPKDVVFVLDISRSMEDEQVGKIIDAIKYIISAELESEDRFNIVLFSKDNQIFSESMVLRGFNDWDMRLMSFFRDVVSRGQTDVYGSLAPVINRWTTSSERAGLILLISDGRSTRGIQEPSEVIRKITVLNGERWRIYCFGNERADKELLDMLSYMNRGYSFYAKNFIRMDKEMLALFEKCNVP